MKHALLVLLCVLLAACGAPDVSLRATSMPNPTGIPATPGPSPTPPPYPAPYPAPQAVTAPNPHLSARWDSASSATVQWTQSGRACLSVQHASGQGVFIGCYDKVGTITLALGGPQTDGAYRPTTGDVFVLVSNGAITKAPLRGRDVYLPVMWL